MPESPSQDEVLSWFDACSNWGRWGPDDEKGTLNYVTPEVTRRAAALVRAGETVGCSRLIPRQLERDFRVPPLHLMVQSGDAFVGRPTPDDVMQAATEFFGLVFHGFAVSHVDSLGHVFRDGLLYNGHPADKVSTAAGATILSVDAMRDGVVTRGVLLDIARTVGVPWLPSDFAIHPEHLEAAEAAAGVRVGEGDVLLCRYGMVARRDAEGPSDEVFLARPGLHAACVPWLHERKIAALGSDTAQDLFPSGYEKVRLPVHEIGIVAMGLYLLDNCDLERLAATCERLGRWEFMLSLGPLRIEHATGSPLNPVAVF